MGPRATGSLIPTGDSLHPSRRADAGQTKTDAVAAPPAPARSLYVVTSYAWDNRSWLAGLGAPEVHATAAAANAAARAMVRRYAEVLNEPGGADEFEFLHDEDQECGDAGLYNGKLVRKNAQTAAEVRVFRADGPEPAGRSERTRRKSKVWERSTVKAGSVSNEDEDDDADVRDGDGDEDEDEEDEEDRKSAKRSRSHPARANGRTTSSMSTAGLSKGRGRAAAPPKTAVQASMYRKKIPEAKPNSLRGLKLLFTGTFETMDRRTSIATAAKYGAEVVSKLEDTDYIVVGLRAGPNKLREINEKELETIDEDEFLDILRNGVSKEKRQRMAARRRADEEAMMDQESGGEDGSDGGGGAAAKGRGRRKRARR